jgi:hypothetical protein
MINYVTENVLEDLPDDVDVCHALLYALPNNDIVCQDIDLTHYRLKRIPALDRFTQLKVSHLEADAFG